MFSGMRSWLSRSGICALTGSLAGSIAGMICGLALLAVPSHTIPFQQALQIGIVLGIVVWLIVLFLLLAFGRYSAGAVLWPSLFTCLLVSIVTVLIVNALHQTYLGMLLGWIIGFLRALPPSQRHSRQPHNTPTPAPLGFRPDVCAESIR
jgi:hypothetical protein